MINSPDILFADEPTGALNSKAADEIMSLLTEINKNGTAIMLVTHDAKVAAQAKRVLFMKDGQIVYEMPTSEPSHLNMKGKVEFILERMREMEI